MNIVIIIGLAGSNGTDSARSNSLFFDSTVVKKTEYTL